MIRFLLLSPVAGAFGFVAADQLLAVSGLIDSSLTHPETVSAVFATVPILWLYGLLLAYPIGLLPAILCAFLYERVLRTKKSLSRPMQGLIGSAVGLGVAAIFGGALFHSSGSSLIAIVPWAAAGMFGGGIAAIVSSISSRPDANVV